MHGDLVPRPAAAAPAGYTVPPGLSRAGLGDAAGQSGSFPWARLIAAVLRYKWLILAIVIAGAGAGYVVSRSVSPSYETYSTIWIAPAGDGRNSGPIRARELM